MKDTFFGQTEILETLRTRICLTPPQDSHPLQETALAKEFNVSRTPIRQVLQTLAREHLVEIRPSVGASISVLPQDGRKDSFHVYRDITVIAAGMSDGQAVATKTVMDLVGVQGILNSDLDVSSQTYVALSVRVQTAIAAEVTDPVVKDAMLASFWRVVRWRVSDIEADPETQFARFRISVDTVATAARSGDAGALLRAVAELSEKLVQGHNS